MKYKACCNMRCLVAGCEISENGGCYCACRMSDKIKRVKSIIAGETFEYGCVYVVNNEKHFNSLSPEKQAEELAFREKMKAHLPELEQKFKEKYEN